MDPITVQATMQDGTIIVDVAHTLSQLHLLVRAYRNDPDCVRLEWWQDPPPPPPVTVVACVRALFIL